MKREFEESSDEYAEKVLDACRKKPDDYEIKLPLELAKLRGATRKKRKMELSDSENSDKFEQ